MPIKITLSRPEKAWKKAIGMNMVGCMLGFYVYSANEQPHKDVIINKEAVKFVPWNEVSEEVCLSQNPDGYIIMPATYEARQHGPFILSVASEAEFSLTTID